MIIGSRGPIEIQPRSFITKNVTVSGVNLFNQTAEEKKEALRLMNGLAEKCPELMSPLIDREYPLEEARSAHEEVIAHKSGVFGRILINPDLWSVCSEKPENSIHLLLSTAIQDGSDPGKGLLDVVVVLPVIIHYQCHLRSRDDNLSRHENEENDLRIHHSVDEAGKELGLVLPLSLNYCSYSSGIDMVNRQALQTDWELVVANSDNVVDTGLDFIHFRNGNELLRIILPTSSNGENRDKLLCCSIDIVAALRPGEDNLAGFKYKSRALRIANSHNEGSKSLIGLTN